MPDFNGDGRDDILWWSLNALSNWLGDQNGGFFVNDAAAMMAVDPAWDWEILGTGDFNGDGRDDILWISDLREITTSLGTSNGGFAPNNANVVFSPAYWIVVGIGDFNADGRDDLLWWNYSDRIATWSGADIGGFIKNPTSAVSPGSASWNVVGIGDFNGDGRDDILWRNLNTGALSNWLASPSGDFTVNDANAWNWVASTWWVQGVGDFNGDGRDDILWRSSTGSLSNWLGTNSGGFLVNDVNAFVDVSTDWFVAGVGDYNGDGRDDILWRNTEIGAVSNWLGTQPGGWAINDAAAYARVDDNWMIGANWYPWDDYIVL